MLTDAPEYDYHFTLTHDIIVMEMLS